MTLRVRAKVLLHVWSYDFYDMRYQLNILDSSGNIKRITVLLIYNKTSVARKLMARLPRLFRTRF